MAGNAFAWCQNDKQEFKIVNGFTNDKAKALRGGSFINGMNNAATTYRDYGNFPYLTYDGVGIRLVVALTDTKA